MITQFNVQNIEAFTLDNIGNKHVSVFYTKIWNEIKQKLKQIPSSTNSALQTNVLYLLGRQHIRQIFKS